MAGMAEAVLSTGFKLPLLPSYLFHFAGELIVITTRDLSIPRIFARNVDALRPADFFGKGRNEEFHMEWLVRVVSLKRTTSTSRMCLADSRSLY
jgi:hypothetical protein